MSSFAGGNEYESNIIDRFAFQHRASEGVTDFGGRISVRTWQRPSAVEFRPASGLFVVRETMRIIVIRREALRSLNP